MHLHQGAEDHEDRRHLLRPGAVCEALHPPRVPGLRGGRGPQLDTDFSSPLGCDVQSGLSIGIQGNTFTDLPLRSVPRYCEYFEITQVRTELPFKMLSRAAPACRAKETSHMDNVTEDHENVFEVQHFFCSCT